MLLALLLLAAGCASEPGLPSGDAGADVVVRCEPPRAQCGSRCVNLESDMRHCGACNRGCPAGSFCSLGACGATCARTLTACGAACVDLARNPDHCGRCGNPCTTDRVCAGGVCTCPVGLTECASRCTDLTTDRANCGACGTACVSGDICNTGACMCSSGGRETECTDGFDDDCDMLVDCLDDDCNGATRPCMGACGMGIETCGGATWGACTGGSGTAEICGDGIDQDCNGSDLRNLDLFEPNNTCADCELISGSVDPNLTLNAGFDSVEDNVDCYYFHGDDSTSPVAEFIFLDLRNIPVGHDYDLYLYRGIDDCRSRNSLASSLAAGNVDERIVSRERFGSDDTADYYIRVVRFQGHSCTDNYELAVNGLR